MNQMKEELVADILSWLKVVVFAVLFALFINNVVIVNASVPTGSMENNIMTKDRIVAFRLSYLNADPQRYDIVVFHYPDDEDVLFVKRVIGLPGETVVIKAGKVYIDGSDTPLEDSFTKETPDPYDFGPYEVPEGHYFVMGDNRNFSRDSRMWNNTYVSKNKILGKVVFSYFPKFRIYSNNY